MSQRMLYRADLLRAAKAAKQLTNDQLSELSGIGTTLIHEVLREKASNPTVKPLKALADALDVNFADLFLFEEVASA